MSIDIFEEYNIKLPTIKEIDEIDNPPVLAKFTNGVWNWYVVAGDKFDDDYLLFGVVEGDYKEMGTFTLSQLENVSAVLTLDFDNIGLHDL